MRYVGRHRASRPLYLRRPVIGGVAAALVVGGPALALTTPGGGPTASRSTRPPSATAARTPDTLVPTDAPLPSQTPGRRPRTTSAAPLTASTSRPLAPTTTTTSRSSTTTTKPRTTTKKPTTTTKAYKPVDVTGLSLSPSSVAPGDVVTGSFGATGGQGALTYSISPSWLKISGSSIGGTVPTDQAAGDVTVTVTATDGRSTDSGSAQLTVVAAAG